MRYCAMQSWLYFAMPIVAASGFACDDPAHAVPSSHVYATCVTRAKMMRVPHHGGPTVHALSIHFSFLKSTRECSRSSPIVPSHHHEHETRQPLSIPYHALDALASMAQMWLSIVLALNHVHWIAAAPLTHHDVAPRRYPCCWHSMRLPMLRLGSPLKSRGP